MLINKWCVTIETRERHQIRFENILIFNVFFLCKTCIIKIDKIFGLGIYETRWWWLYCLFFFSCFLYKIILKTEYSCLWCDRKEIKAAIPPVIWSLQELSSSLLKIFTYTDIWFNKFMLIIPVSLPIECSTN